jgi:hypothetical protein
MLFVLLTVLNCPIINVTHCKKIHNNYCVPACIYFYWRNKQTLPSTFIMIFNQSDSSDVEVSGEEDEDSCWLIKYHNKCLSQCLFVSSVKVNACRYTIIVVYFLTMSNIYYGTVEDCQQNKKHAV